MKNLKRVEAFSRHGDLVVFEHKGNTPKLVASQGKLVVAGSHGGAHYLPEGTLFAKQEHDTFVQLVGGDAPIQHADRHHDSQPLVAGTVYRITPQVARHGEFDLTVED